MPTLCKSFQTFFRKDILSTFHDFIIDPEWNFNFKLKMNLFFAIKDYYEGRNKN